MRDKEGRKEMVKRRNRRGKEELYLRRYKIFIGSKSLHKQVEDELKK
jgi:hypothetical protein